MGLSLHLRRAHQTSGASGEAVSRLQGLRVDDATSNATLAARSHILQRSVKVVDVVREIRGGVGGCSWRKLVHRVVMSTHRLFHLGIRGPLRLGTGRWVAGGLALGSNSANTGATSGTAAGTRLAPVIASNGCLEAGEAHPRGMTVGDRIEKDRIGGNDIPVDLAKVNKRNRCSRVKYGYIHPSMSSASESRRESGP